MALSTWVYVWLAVAAIVAIGISIMAGKRSADNLDSYLVSGWDVGVVVIAGTAVASWISGGAYVGVPGIIYAFGWSAALYVGLLTWVGFVIGVVLNAGPLQKYSRALHSLSISELLGRRYDSKSVQIISSVFLLLFFIPLMVAQAKAGASLLQVTTDLSPVQSLIIFGMIMVIIVSIGGFKGVAWTDATILFGMLVVSISLVGTAFIKAGGPLAVTDAMAQASPQHLALFNPPLFDPVSSIGWLLLGFLGTIALPQSVTRFMGMKNAEPESLRKLMIFVLIFSTIVTMLTALSGIAAFGALTEPLENPDLVIPTMIQSFFPGPIGGLFTVAILGAIITTLSTVLLLVTTALTRDILQGGLMPEMEDNRAETVARILTVLVVVIVVGLATQTLQLIALLQAITYVTLGITFFLVLTVGFYWKSANKYGANASIVAMAVGAPALLIQGYDIGEIGTYMAIIIAVLFFGGSLITGGEKIGSNEFYESLEDFE